MHAIFAVCLTSFISYPDLIPFWQIYKIVESLEPTLLKLTALFTFGSVGSRFPTDQIGYY